LSIASSRSRILHLDVVSLSSLMRNDPHPFVGMADGDPQTCTIHLITLPLLQSELFFKWNLRHVGTNEKKPTEMEETEESINSDPLSFIVVDPAGVYLLNEIQDRKRKTYSIGSLVIKSSGEMVGFLVSDGIALLRDWTHHHKKIAHILTHRFSMWKGHVGSGYFRSFQPQEASENTGDEETKEQINISIDDLEDEQMKWERH
jgi:hypothetical protein